jgi:radical SAM family uncharacterized protein
MIDRDKFIRLLEGVRKPGRYIGGEWNSVKKGPEGVDIKVALSFPDLYEVGMSHLGFKLIYHLLNERDDTACERVFMPDTDMQALMEADNVPLFTLESREPVSGFDLLGFSMAYELNYTNVLNMLRLAGIPLKAGDRGEEAPLVIAGGPSAFNPEPMADFIDLFVIGEAEEALAEIIEALKESKKDPGPAPERADLLKKLNRIEGVYVPSLYDPSRKIKKRTVSGLAGSFYPVKQIVPYINVVHDRAAIEIMRGCPHTCRFCQARAVYHPKRERTAPEIIRLAEETIRSTGYEEISLLSLSTGNHSEIIPVISALIDKFRAAGISVSLPSLRIEKILSALPSLLSRIKKSGLTFAPEAGTERLRNIMRKDISIDELIGAVGSARGAGWSRVKLYFMIGIPTETYEDLDGIVKIIYKVLGVDKRINVNVSINPFIPKPHTPFQWSGMDTREELQKKILYLRDRIRSRKVKVKFHDPRLSALEGAFSLGDRRLGAVALRAFEKGCRLDGWTEHLNFSAWEEAFKEEGVDPASYIHARRNIGDPLPWDHIECGLSKTLLAKEASAALPHSQ